MSSTDIAEQNTKPYKNIMKVTKLRDRRVCWTRHFNALHLNMARKDVLGCFFQSFKDPAHMLYGDCGIVHHFCCVNVTGKQNEGLKRHEG